MLEVFHYIFYWGFCTVEGASWTKRHHKAVWAQEALSCGGKAHDGLLRKRISSVFSVCSGSGARADPGTLKFCFRRLPWSTLSLRHMAAMSGLTNMMNFPLVMADQPEVGNQLVQLITRLTRPMKRMSSTVKSLEVGWETVIDAGHHSGLVDAVIVRMARRAVVEMMVVGPMPVQHLNGMAPISASRNMQSRQSCGLPQLVRNPAREGHYFYRSWARPHSKRWSS